MCLDPRWRFAKLLHLVWLSDVQVQQATINGKKVELPVKRIISGDRVKPSGTLANPQSLEYYYQFAKVEELSKPLSKL